MTPEEAEGVKTLLAEIGRLRAEVAQWKAYHADMKRKKHIAFALGRAYEKAIAEGVEVVDADDYTAPHG